MKLKLLVVVLLSVAGIATEATPCYGKIKSYSNIDIGHPRNGGDPCMNKLPAGNKSAPTGYCTSGGSNGNRRIDKFQLGSINKMSPLFMGYQDFTYLATSLVKGLPNQFKITPEYIVGTTYPSYAIFIDYNQNGNFNDPGETVWAQNPYHDNEVTGQFIVPYNALSGATRMRVSMKAGGIPTACESFSTGQVHDYTVNIVADPEALAPLSPSVSLTPTTATLSWSAAAAILGVTDYLIYSGNTFLGSVSSTTFVASGLTPATQYSFVVKARNAVGSIMKESAAVIFTTLQSGSNLAYCNQPIANAIDRIGRVRIGTIDYTSTGTMTYENFTGISTTIAKGSENRITINPSLTNGNFPLGYAVYIDYNRNGVFTDSGEMVWSNAPTANEVSGLFTVPLTALDGVTRMRVMGRRDMIPQSCWSSSYGQVEDYTVVLVNDTTPPSAPVLSASNITYTSATLSWLPATDNIGIKRYDVYFTGILMGSTTSTSYTFSGLNPSASFFSYIIAIDTAGNATMSNFVNVTTLSLNDYCSIQGNNTSDERIGRVQFAGINNPSNSAAGYENFTAVSTTVERGSSNTITITPFWTGQTFSEAYTVYIDYNRNNNFTDPGETVFLKAGTHDASVSGTITIPLTASLGPTRMRVAMSYAAPATSPCNSFSYGQVEDYTVFLTNDTTAPTAPFVSASGTTQTTSVLSWYGAIDNMGVTGYDIYRNGSFIGSTASLSYTITELSPSSGYSFFIKAKDAVGNMSASSNVINVTTLPTANSVSYCSSQTTYTHDERIGGVQFAGISNFSTGAAGYENFTSISANVTRNSSNTITITPYWAGNTFDEGYAVYIDYNQNGVFTDPGEIVFTKSPSRAVSVSGNIIVPASAALGSTRMRVIMWYGGMPSSSCGSFLYGQVEDYTVNIVGSARVAETVEAATPAPVSFTLYPNPVKDDVLNISNLIGKAGYRIFNAIGQELSKGTIENESVYVGSLAAGTYLIEVSNAGGTASKRFIKQ